MKITRSELKQLIAESISESRSVLLEMPQPPIVGQEQTGDYTKDPDSYEGEEAKDLFFICLNKPNSFTICYRATKI